MPIARTIRYVYRPLLLASAAFCALQTTTAAAQTRYSSSFLEEIVVTSTKMGASLVQETPLAVTALSASMLDEIQYENVEDIAGLVPNLSISQNDAAARIYIRGIGTNLDFVGSDPSVAVYLDGVYLARPTAVFSDFIDVERIEILRGPQGTLYGRNAAGGVISIISKKPSNDLEGRITGEYGSYDKWRLSGSVSGGLVEDKLAVGVSVLRAKRDGYIDNFGVGPDHFNNEDIKTFRGVISITPTETLKINLSADYNEEQTRYAYSPLHVDVLGNPVNIGAQVFSDPYDVSTNIDGISNYTENYGYSGNIVWDVADNVSITSITAYRKSIYDVRLDSDFTELSIFVSNLAQSSRQFTQEFQIQGTTDSFQWTAGLYYLNERHGMNALIELPGAGFGPDFGNITYALGHTDAYAAFAQGTYNLTDRLSVTAGIRYSYEKKDIDKDVFLVIGDTPLPFGNFVQFQKGSWNAWTPKFSIDYKIDEDKLIYASVTRGFKSGGFNFSSFQSPFDPEFLWSYEVGLKSDWLEKRLRMNISAFYYDYKDLQIQGFYIPPDGSAAGVLIANAASAEVKGIELELTASPADGWLLMANAAYLNATYGDYITARSATPNIPVDVTGNRLNNAPKWMFNVAAQYGTEINNIGYVSGRVEFRWQDDIFYTVFNDPAVGQSSYGLLNASLAWESMDKSWKITAYGKNLTDKLYYPAKPDWSPTGVGGALPEPRVFGLNGSYRF